MVVKVAGIQKPKVGLVEVLAAMLLYLCCEHFVAIVNEHYLFGCGINNKIRMTSPRGTCAHSIGYKSNQYKQDGQYNPCPAERIRTRLFIYLEVGRLAKLGPPEKGGIAARSTASVRRTLASLFMILVYRQTLLYVKSFSYKQQSAKRSTGLLGRANHLVNIVC